MLVIGPRRSELVAQPAQVGQRELREDANRLRPLAFIAKGAAVPEAFYDEERVLPPCPNPRARGIVVFACADNCRAGVPQRLTR